MSRVTAPSTHFTVAEFERMVYADVFGSTRVELINGRIYRMAPQRDPHMAAVSRANRLLSAIVPQSEWLAAPGTLRFDKFTVVDPDLLWLELPVGSPRSEHDRIILVIEVSDRTYRKDSGVKLRKYAEAGIEDYWIINLRDNRLEVYREPKNPTGRRADCHYASATHLTLGSTVSPLLRPAVKIRVDEVLM